MFCVSRQRWVPGAGASRPPCLPAPQLPGLSSGREQLLLPAPERNERADVGDTARHGHTLHGGRWCAHGRAAPSAARGAGRGGPGAPRPLLPLLMAELATTAASPHWSALETE